MTKEETRETILLKIDEFATALQKELENIREKDRNGEYIINQDGYSCDYAKDAIYDFAEESIGKLHYIHGFINGLFNYMK